MSFTNSFAMFTTIVLLSAIALLNWYELVI
jgi:hypothetical protein